jgi:hypothetical protein
MTFINALQGFDALMDGFSNGVNSISRSKSDRSWIAAYDNLAMKHNALVSQYNALIKQNAGIRSELKASRQSSDSWAMKSFVENRKLKESEDLSAYRLKLLKYLKSQYDDRLSEIIALKLGLEAERAMPK